MNLRGWDVHSVETQCWMQMCTCSHQQSANLEDTVFQVGEILICTHEHLHSSLSLTWVQIPHALRLHISTRTHDGCFFMLLTWHLVLGSRNPAIISDFVFNWESGFDLTQHTHPWWLLFNVTDLAPCHWKSWSRNHFRRRFQLRVTRNIGI